MTASSEAPPASSTERRISSARPSEPLQRRVALGRDLGSQRLDSLDSPKVLQLLLEALGGVAQRPVAGAGLGRVVGREPPDRRGQLGAALAEPALGGGEPLLGGALELEPRPAQLLGRVAAQIGEGRVDVQVEPAACLGYTLGEALLDRLAEPALGALGAF